MMNKKISVLLSLLLVLTFSGFAGGQQDTPDDGKLNVVATIGMIADVAAEIGGDLVTVTPLMGAGVDPHLYKASAGDIRRLKEADLILYNGLYLEAKMGEVLDRMAEESSVVAVGEVVDQSKLDKSEDYEDHFDPHIWFDVLMWKEVAGAVKDAMVEELPESKAALEANFIAYADKMDSLHLYVESQVARIDEKKRVIITAHDAFNYFGRAYGFEVRGLQGISTASEAGTGDMQDLADYIAEKRIPAIFVESSVPRKNVEALQAAVKSRGFDVTIGGELFSDAMGDPGTEEGTYLGMVKHNIDTVVAALGE